MDNEEEMEFVLRQVNALLDSVRRQTGRLEESKIMLENLPQQLHESALTAATETFRSAVDVLCQAIAEHTTMTSKALFDTQGVMLRLIRVVAWTLSLFTAMFVVSLWLMFRLLFQ